MFYNLKAQEETSMHLSAPIVKFPFFALKKALCIVDINSTDLNRQCSPTELSPGSSKLLKDMMSHHLSNEDDELKSIKWKDSTQINTGILFRLKHEQTGLHHLLIWMING
jgi:hypothetical protein